MSIGDLVTVIPLYQPMLPHLANRVWRVRAVVRDTVQLDRDNDESARYGIQTLVKIGFCNVALPPLG